MIVTVWKKDLEIKVAFEGSDHLMIKKCNTQKEFDETWETVEAICHGIGAVIKLK